MNERIQKYDTSNMETRIPVVDNHLAVLRQLTKLMRNSSSSPIEQQTIDKAFCFECGEQMSEVERLNENGALFIWYECGVNDCDGQWLQRIPWSIVNNLSGGYC